MLEVVLDACRLLLDAAEAAVPVRALAVLAGAAVVTLCLRLALRNSSGFSSGE
jgi:hypothetical protein